VTNVSVYGVFVDLGAVRDARLNVPKAIGRKFRIGDVVQDCVIDKLDLEQGRMSVALPEEALEAAAAKDSKATPKASAKAKAKVQVKAKAEAKTQVKAKAKAQVKAKAKAPAVASLRVAPDAPAQNRLSQRSRSLSQPKRRATPLEELQEGDVFEGTVTNVSVYGVFVDLGAVRDARLNVPKAIGRKFRIGDVVQDCVIDKLDLEQGRMSVALPEEALEAAAAKDSKATPKASAKAKAKAQVKAKAKAATTRAPAEVPRVGSTSAKAKPRAKSVPRGGTSSIAIEKLRVGLAVDGIVTNNNQYGVFVNIGCAKDARLNVSRQMAKEFRKGDEIYGMTIESVDLEKNQISCSLEDPELFVEEETAPSRRRK